MASKHPEQPSRGRRPGNNPVRLVRARPLPPAKLARALYGEAFGQTKRSLVADAMAEWEELSRAERDFTIAHLLYLNLQAQSTTHRLFGEANDTLEEINDAVDAIADEMSSGDDPTLFDPHGATEDFDNDMEDDDGPADDEEVASSPGLSLADAWAGSDRAESAESNREDSDDEQSFRSEATLEAPIGIDEGHDADDRLAVQLRLRVVKDVLSRSVRKRGP